MSGAVLHWDGHRVSSVITLHLHLPDFVSLCSSDWAEVTLGCFFVFCFFSPATVHITPGALVAK